MAHVIELPPGGAAERVAASVPLAFDWSYGANREPLLRLYQQGKLRQWNAATDLDWSIDVDPERPWLEGYDVMALLEPPERLDPPARARLFRHFDAWMLSQFLHGEQGALLATAQIVNTVPWLEAKLYAANQIADEARHVEVYRRYLIEKLEISYPINPDLHALLTQIAGESRWDMLYLGMQIMVEGLALAAFGVMRLLRAHEPLILEITSRVMRDEARHVAFGVLALENLYTNEMSSAELAEREEFVIDATTRLHDRLIMHELWPRIGLDATTWDQWALTTPFMVGFRQILFSKIVPNLKRLGLLTPKVRKAFAALGILEFELFPDSVADQRTATPPALHAFAERLRAAGVARP